MPDYKYIKIMKFLDTEVFPDPETQEISVKVTLTRKNIDYLQEGLRFLLNKPYNLQDNAQAARFQQISMLENDLQRAWEATDPNPVNRMPLDLTKVQVVTNLEKPINPDGEPQPEEPFPLPTDEPPETTF